MVGDEMDGNLTLNSSTGGDPLWHVLQLLRVSDGC